MKGNYVAKNAHINKGGAHRDRKKDYRRKPKHPKRDGWR